MERFTERTESGRVYLTPEPETDIYGNLTEKGFAQIGAIYNRLAAYEDTGLEPDEITHWIPVSERLPEPEVNVLICQNYCEDAPYSNITIGHLHQESDLRGKPYWTWIAHGADMVNPKIDAYHRAEFICPGNEFVTHWMPLPQPPKEEKRC